MCRCCSFESLDCRRRTLKCSGSFLIVFGVVFFLGGIAIAILPQVYAELPDVFSTYIFYSFLVPTTGIAAVVTGMGAIHMGRIMSDDDCSARGVSILALLTIVCSLASVGLPAWPLYEGGYFLEVPSDTQSIGMNNTTSFPTTQFMTTLPGAMTTRDEANSNTTMSPANTTVMAMDGTTMNASAGNATSSTDSSAGNMTAMNATDAAMSMNSTDNQMPANTTDGPISAGNATNNASSADAMSTSAPDNTTTGSGANAENSTAPSTPDTETDSLTNTLMVTNSTNSTMPTDVPRVPIPYELWFDVIVPFGIICVFALIFVLCALLICFIGCCCSDYSEIVDDNDIYKT